MLLQLRQGLDELEAADAGGIGGHAVGHGGDPLGEVVDGQVVLLQAVDHAFEGGILATDHGEEVGILERVVGVDEAAVVEATEPEPPERAVGLQGPELGDDGLRGKAGANLVGEAADDREVAPQVGMDGEQLAEHAHGTDSGLGGVGDGHGSMLRLKARTRLVYAGA